MATLIMIIVRTSNNARRFTLPEEASKVRKEKVKLSP
jgi:hypothetical protein